MEAKALVIAIQPAVVMALWVKVGSRKWTEEKYKTWLRISVVAKPDISCCPDDASVQEHTFPVAGDSHVLPAGQRIADKQEQGRVKEEHICEGNWQPVEPVAIDIPCEGNKPDRGESDRYRIERGYPPECH